MLGTNLSLSQKLTRLETKLGLIKQTDLFTIDGIAFWVAHSAVLPVKNKPLYSIVELADLAKQGWLFNFDCYNDKKPFSALDEAYSSHTHAAHHYFWPRYLDSLKDFLPFINQFGTPAVIEQILKGELDQQVALAKQYQHTPQVIDDAICLPEQQLLQQWLDDDVQNQLPEAFVLPLGIDQKPSVKANRATLYQLHYTFDYSINYCGIGFLGLVRRVYLFAFIQYVETLLLNKNFPYIDLLEVFIREHEDHQDYFQNNKDEICLRLVRALEVAESQFCK